MSLERLKAMMMMGLRYSAVVEAIKPFTNLFSQAPSMPKDLLFVLHQNDLGNRALPCCDPAVHIQATCQIPVSRQDETVMFLFRAASAKATIVLPWARRGGIVDQVNRERLWSLEGRTHQVFHLDSGMEEGLDLNGRRFRLEVS